jgi:hypothetical protein
MCTAKKAQQQQGHKQVSRQLHRSNPSPDMLHHIVVTTIDRQTYRNTLTN